MGETRRGRGDGVALPMGPAPWPRATSLEGFGIRLEPARPGSDARELHGPTHGDPDGVSTWQHLAYGPFAGVEDLERWLSEGLASRDPVFFIVRTEEEDRAVGHVSYLRIRPERRCLEIGHIWYVPAVRRTHVNTAAAFLLLDEAFRLGYRRVEWRCHHRNGASQRAALRLGFRFEGSLRQHMVSKGENRDTLTFSILDGEWPRLRSAIGAWLKAAPEDRGSLGRRIEEARAGSELEARPPGVSSSSLGSTADRPLRDLDFVGERFGLRWRLTRHDDLERVLDIEADPTLGRFLGRWSPARHEAARTDPGQAHLAVVDPGDGTWLGYAILAWGLDDPGVELVRIAVARPGRGFGRRILMTLVNDVLRRLGRTRLGLDVVPENEAALALYDSLGFQREGRRRAALRRGSGVGDLIVMSRVPGDPGPWE